MVHRRKNIQALFLLPLLLFSCADGSSSSAEVQEEVSALAFPERAKSMNIYEVNIRTDPFSRTSESILGNRSP